MISYIDICHLIFLPLTLLNQVQVLSLTLWTRGGPKTDPLITKPQVIEYGKLYRSEEPEGDGRASTTFDFRLSKVVFIPGSKGLTLLQMAFGGPGLGSKIIGYISTRLISNQLLKNF